MLLIAIVIAFGVIEIVRLVQAKMMKEGTLGLAGAHFADYKRLRVHSSVFFLSTVGVTLAIAVLVGAMKVKGWIGYLPLIIFLVGLIVSAVYGSKAQGVLKRSNAENAANQRSKGAQPADEASDEGAASRLDDLKKLGELRDKGLLTDEEFQKEKASLLGTNEGA
jgi:hypothetical protein